MKEGARQGIVLVGIHGWAFPGPNKELGVYYNIQQDPREIGRAQADWVIAHSDGKARVVVTTHCEYADRLHQGARRPRTGSPSARAARCWSSPTRRSPRWRERQPALVTAWVQKYGTPLYITSVADYTADYQVPPLRAGGVADGEVILVSADGNRSAYERIRAGGQYQMVTASEPYRMQAYQAIDELNRAFHGKEPLGLAPADAYLVTPENVDAEGGDKNTFIPGNGYEEKYLSMWGVK